MELMEKMETMPGMKNMKKYVKSNGNALEWVKMVK